jgi:hypothetical protein
MEITKNKDTHSDKYSPEGAVCGFLATKTVEKSVSSANDMMEGGITHKAL